MTFFTTFQDGSQQQSTAGIVGPFVAIDVPPTLALTLAENRPVHLLGLQDICSAGLDRLNDAVVACMLFGGATDALEVIAALLAAGYKGPVLVVAPRLPDGALVLHELKRAAGDLHITLVQV